MPQNALIPCGGCQRHVYTNETRCPFCDAQLSVSEIQQLKMSAPGGKHIPRSRAASYALRAAILASTAGAACTSNESTEAPDAQAVDAGGSEPVSDASVDASPALQDSGSSEAVNTEDASAQADAAAPAEDDDAGFVVVAIYGGVFPDPKTRARV
ncbi:MAG: hypothetical protein OEZ06_09765 [Myxococcales bacterium]|nr:hypothetical protein [Myxococcales bacterium]